MIVKIILILALTLVLTGLIKKESENRELLKKIDAFYAREKRWHLEAQEKSSNESAKVDEQMELLSIVATQTENAIMIMDPEGNIEWINDGFTRMYGYSFDEFIKIRGNNIRQTSFSGIIDERLRLCKHSGQPVVYDAPNETVDGREIWTRTTLTPIFNEEEEVTHLAAIDTDIHRRKTASDVLLRELNVLRERLNQLTRHQKKVTNVIARLLANQDKTGEEVKATHDIVRFINDVSDRIKIMGLNASIEAASLNGDKKSGGAGQGFRVLASEIIQMSDETKVQSEKIGGVISRLSGFFEIIEGGKKEVEETSQQYYNVVNDLEEGLRKVEEVADELNG